MVVKLGAESAAIGKPWRADSAGLLAPIDGLLGDSTGGPREPVDALC